MTQTTERRRGADPGDAVQMSLRLRMGQGVRLGPGKIRLLAMIAEQGSISAAARSMGMSYRRAWLLVNSINQVMAEPVVESRSGGRQGGGAVLTRTGERLIGVYRQMERKALLAVEDEIRMLEGLTAGDR